VSKEWGAFFDTSIPSSKPAWQEFNLLNGTIELPGESLGTVV